MHLNNEHYAEVEILSFKSHCKIDEMSYEQLVNVRTSEGSVIRLFDFMGFAVNESRLGKNKKIVLCIRFLDGEIVLLKSGRPGIVDSDFDWEGETPTKLTLVGKILEADGEDHDLLVDVGFGEIYVIPDADVSVFKKGDIIRFRADRLDLIEIIE